MLFENISPLALEIVLTGTFAAFLLTVLIWLFFLLRYLKAMENSLLQLSTAHTVTQECQHHLQTTTEEEMQQLRLTQASIRAHGRSSGEGDPALASGWEG
jgi:hypothetical protein